MPAAWLDARATVEIALPLRLRCHACQGGGCDACGRSGVFRLPERAEDRRLELPLPPEACVLRLRDPIEAGEPQLVILSVSVGEATENVRRLSPEPTPARMRLWWWAAAAIAVASAIAVAVS